MSITALPPMTHTFTLSVKGSRTGRVFDGTFTFTIPTLRTESEIEKTRIRLNEGLTVSEDIDFLHEMVAFLAATLTESPEWWKKSAVKLEIHDLNVYTKIFEETSKFQKEWRDKVWAEDGKQS